MIGRSRQDYGRALASLLPIGFAWTRDPGSVLHRLLLALAGPLFRADARVVDLIEESDPRTALETLVEWERAYALPDSCAPAPDLVEERRDALITRIIGRGGQSVAYFEGVAARIGFPVTIDEFDPLTCVDPCIGSLYGDDWVFVWRLNAAAVTIRDATCLDGCTAPLRDWGNEPLECTIALLKPAHTIALFRYG